MAQDGRPTIYCVFGEGKQKNPNTYCKYVRDEEPLKQLKQRLNLNQEPHMVSPGWANQFHNVYYSEDGT